MDELKNGDVIRIEVKGKFHYVEAVKILDIDAYKDVPGEPCVKVEILSSSNPRTVAGWTGAMLVSYIKKHGNKV